ncbi:MAG: hypothetical protein HC774_06245 [Sphingomonadales bacterium]|nr:hypothetical protein [Sphingomonadales bacterium]
MAIREREAGIQRACGTGDRQAWDEFLSSACQSIIRAHIEDELGGRIS